MINEKLILGHLLLQPELIKELDLDIDFFERRENKLIFKELRSAGKNTDVALFYEKLQGRVKADYISSLMEGIPRSNANNVFYYINIVQAARLKKKVASLILSGTKTGCLDNEKIRKYYEEIDRLERPSGSSITETLKNLHERDVPARSLLIDPILGRQEICILSGFPKSGKSVLSLNLAIRLAQGRDWLGFNIPAPAKVLILQQEVAVPLFKDRLELMISEEKEFSFLQNISHNKERGLLLDSGAGLNTISRTIEMEKPDLVILDPLIKFHSKQENRSDEMEEIFKAIQSLVDKYLISFFIIHHFAKSQEDKIGGYMQRGSSVISASSDSNWQWNYLSKEGYKLSDEDFLKAMELSFEFRNTEPICPLILKSNELLWFEEIEPSRKIKAGYRDIYEEVKKAGGSIHRPELEKKFVPEKCSHRTFIKAVQKAEQQGLIDSTTLERSRGSSRVIFLREGL